MASGKDCVELVISLAFGLFAVWINVYMTGFLANIQVPYLVPTTVDDSDSSRYQILAEPLWNNLLLLLGFGLLHSGMPRESVRHLAYKLFPENYYRVFYVGVNSAYLLGVLHCWAPMPYPIWDVHHEYLKLFIHGLFLLTGVGLAWSLMILDPLMLLGIRGPLNRVLKRENEELHLVTTGMYGLMRHPSYTFLILHIWSTPTMSVGHFLFSLIFTGYILIAVAHFEEPDLVRAIGPDYVEYARKTPRYIPNFFGSHTKKDS